MTSAVIFGCQGERLSEQEIAFFKEAQPFGYILFARNCRTPQQVKALVSQLKNISGRSALPILIDQEGGRVARLKPPAWKAFPPASVFADAAARDATKAKRAVYLNARLIAHELAMLGINVNCAPVADLRIPGSHDIIGDRAFGETPEQVSVLAAAQAKGLMDGGVLPVVKHIPGHGRAGVDSHEQLPVVDTPLEVLRASDFKTFKALNDLPMAMTAHVVYSAIDAERPATVSPDVIRIIRNEIGFDGLLMSDDLSMKALSGDFVQRTKASLDAGCDLVLHCNGNFREMKDIMSAAPAMTGKANIRAHSALAQLYTPKPMDVAAAESEIAQLLA